MAKFNEVVSKRNAKDSEEKQLTLIDLENPKTKKNVVESLRYRISHKIKTGEI